MKKILLTFTILATLCSACTKQETAKHYSREYGEKIIFGTSSKQGSSTKVAYSGSIDGDKYERIDWESGDQLRIYCPEASAPSSKYTDYSIKAGSVTSSGRSSSASITNDPSSTGLCWGTGTHHFTSLYPAPGAGVAGTSVGSGTVTCVLPAAQTYTGTGASDGNTTAGINSNYIYLAGYGSATGGKEGDPVDIFFDPAFTLFELTLQNDYDSEANMTVASVGLRSSAGKIAGPYAVNVTGINGTTGTLTKASIDTTALTSTGVSMTFSPAVTVAHGKTIKFSLFAQPGKDISQLTFWFADSEGCTRSFAFKYEDGRWVSFNAFHKIKITGLMAPESAGWTINMTPLVDAWGDSGNTDLDIETGKTQTFTTPAVVSWGTGVNDEDVTLKDVK